MVYYSKVMPSNWSPASATASEQVSGFKPHSLAPVARVTELPTWLDQVEIEPMFAKRWRVRREWRLQPRVLLVDWMMWIERGTIRFEIDGFAEPVTCPAGTLIVIPAGVIHSAICEKSQPAGLITLHFKAQLFGNIGCLNLLDVTGAHKCLTSSPVPDAMHELCRETVLKGVGWHRAMRSQIERVLLYTLRNHRGLRHSQVRDGQHSHLARIQPILKLIDESMDKSNLSVPDLASAAAVSEVSLRRMFRLTLGISPAAYMQRRRAQHAGHLLRTTQLSVKEISARCGFSDPHFMMRVFRKWMRQTPTQFRTARDL
jgi:AraC family transcriptional regulator